MMKTWIILLLGLGLGGFAQTQATFEIESIVVEGQKRALVNLIIAESRLESAKTYTEAEIGAGMDRIQRLPFVLEAKFKLRRGEVKGHYLLAIQVKLQFRFFAQINATFSRLEHRPRGIWQDDLSLGLNQFFGKNNSVYFAVSPGWNGFQSESDRKSVHLGFSNHRVFGSNLFLNLDLTYFEDIEDGDPRFRNQFETDIIPTLNANYYLGKNQWIQLWARAYRERFNTQFLDGTAILEEQVETMRNQLFSFAWERNTTDDSWEPTRGAMTRIHVGYIKSENHEPSQDFRERDLRLNTGISFQKNWSLDFRQVFSWKGLWSFSDSDSRFQLADNPELGTLGDSHRFQMEMTFKVQLFNSLSQYRYGDAFLGFHMMGQQTEDRFRDLTSDDFHRTRRNKSLQINGYLAYRGRWGIARFQLTYSARD